jgi:hypothetical protein
MLRRERVSRIVREYGFRHVLSYRPSLDTDRLAVLSYGPQRSGDKVLDPVKRWFQEFRRELSNKAFETVELLQEALTRTITPYWEG